jgi:hypothetical protein
VSRRRKNAQQKALPIVPPCEEDELISSWLARVARFYGYTVADLLDESDLDIRTIDLAAIDIGLTRAPMGLVANLLNISVELLVAHTIKFALPWAVNALAQEAGSGPFGATPPLRVAICPWCLELQRIDRGFSWLRREWVLAWRTICPRHGVRLRESGDGSVAPGWEDFFRRHTRVQQATCSVSVSTLQYELSASSPPRAGETVPLNDRLLQVQNVLAADPTSDREAVLEGGVALAMMVGDILWALTRSDLAFPDRIAYEAFALQAFDSDWRLARRRSSVPADYARFGVMVRHAMMATAEIIAAGATPPSPLCMPRTRSENELALLLSILITPDAEELVGRSSRWPEQSQAALLGDPH